MKIGVFTVLFQDLSLEKTLDLLVEMGVSAVELGAGGYPGQSHLPVQELLESEQKREALLEMLQSRGLLLSALSVHNNPLHPDPGVAAIADQTIRNAVRLARLLDVPVVNGFSGLPAGGPDDKTPNWITCPWPPHFLESLKYQWDEVAIPYWREVGKYMADQGVAFAFEMHPGMLVYNVETMLRMRTAVGPVLGCNFDPSHLFWNNVDPVVAIRRLGKAIYHVHGKDCYLDHLNIAENGCNDHKPYDRLQERAWTFRTIGYGHSLQTWKDIISALRLVGYDYVISIEHEDALMSPEEGLRKGISLLQQANIVEPPGVITWV